MLQMPLWSAESVQSYEPCGDEGLHDRECTAGAYSSAKFVKWSVHADYAVAKLFFYDLIRSSSSSNSSRILATFVEPHPQCKQAWRQQQARYYKGSNTSIQKGVCHGETVKAAVAQQQ